MAKLHFVYFLQSKKNNSYYIGVTSNIKERFREHNAGLSKSTASKRPWVLVRVEKYPNIETAYRRERFIKTKKSRKIIEKIICDRSPDVPRSGSRDPDSAESGHRDSVGRARES